jgi:hypothetical protein
MNYPRNLKSARYLVAAISKNHKPKMPTNCSQAYSHSNQTRRREACIVSVWPWFGQPAKSSFFSCRQGIVFHYFLPTRARRPRDASMGLPPLFCMSRRLINAPAFRRRPRAGAFGWLGWSLALLSLAQLHAQAPAASGQHPAAINVFSKLEYAPTTYGDTLPPGLRADAAKNRIEIPGADQWTMKISLNDPQTVRVTADANCAVGLNTKTFIYPKGEPRPATPIEGGNDQFDDTMSQLWFSYPLSLTSSLPCHYGTKYVIEVVQTVFEYPAPQPMTPEYAARFANSYHQWTQQLGLTGDSSAFAARAANVEWQMDWLRRTKAQQTVLWTRTIAGAFTSPSAPGPPPLVTAAGPNPPGGDASRDPLMRKMAAIVIPSFQSANASFIADINHLADAAAANDPAKKGVPLRIRALTSIGDTPNPPVANLNLNGQSVLQILNLLCRETHSTYTITKGALQVLPDPNYWSAPAAPAPSIAAPPASPRVLADGKMPLMPGTVFARPGEYEYIMPDGRKIPVTLGPISLTVEQH